MQILGSTLLMIATFVLGFCAGSDSVRDYILKKGQISIGEKQYICTENKTPVPLLPNDKK